jgi:RNA polymerase sigma-70 factor (ECF subfamily)
MDNEQEVINNAQNDPESFGRLYDVYYQPIFGFVYSRIGNSEIAKDLTSETFFQALKNLSKYKPRKGASFKSWLFAIAVAQIGNYFRIRSKIFEVTTEEAPELMAQDAFRPDIAYKMGEDADELALQVGLLKKTIRQLNQKQQNILTLRYFSKMTVPEIATTMKMKEGTIKSHIHRATKKLYVLMTQEVDKNSDNNESIIISKYETKSVKN